jgi:glycosyltransferase involved in cell wall biosynthesis
MIAFGGSKKKVAFLHRVTCDYLESFFVKAEEVLKHEGVKFVVVSGQPWEDEGLIDVLSRLPFGTQCINKRVIGPLYWGSGALAAVRDADMVILEQASGALNNYPLMLDRWWRNLPLWNSWAANRRRVAFWGHGASLNRNKPAPLRDALKKVLTAQVDWWFAYTELSARIVADAGFPAKRITVFQNTIDTAAVREERQRLSEGDLKRLQRTLHADNGRRPTGVFCGRLVGLKWIPFLLESLEEIHRKLPEFRMIIVGDGKYAHSVCDFCRSRPWCVWVGAKRGIDRVPYLAIADVWINPGAVGLAIVDAFAMGLPVVTTDNDIHGPEIAYLRQEENGVMTRPTVQDFAGGVVQLLWNQRRLQALKEQAERDGQLYSIDNMVNNFKHGVLACLNMHEERA